MSVTMAEVPEAKCGCGDVSDRVFVDFTDCGGQGVILKQMSLEDDSIPQWISLTDKQVEHLVGALIEYQNR